VCTLSCNHCITAALSRKYCSLHHCSIRRTWHGISVFGNFTSPVRPGLGFLYLRSACGRVLQLLQVVAGVKGGCTLQNVVARYRMLQFFCGVRGKGVGDLMANTGSVLGGLELVLSRVWGLSIGPA
jgi:hypothetical protein